MRTPEDWVDLDRLKAHLQFAWDPETQTFPGHEQDLVLADCIAAAVRWCAGYTGLPLVEETLTVRCPPPPALDEPLTLPGRVVCPVRVSAVRYWPDDRRDRAGTVVDEASVGLMERVGWPGTRDPALRVWPAEDGLWPSLGPGGWEVDVLKDRGYEGAEGDAVAMAVIQCARDYFEGHTIMERRTAAEHLLRPFRYMGAGK